MKRFRSPFGWKPALLVAIAAVAAACGSTDTATSVYLEIYDSSVIQSPTQVRLDVFDGSGGNQIATLDRMAEAQSTASSPLGSVVIFAGNNASLGTLHIEGRRSSGGAMMSSGSVDVPLVANRQVTARLMLGHAGDAGAGQGGSGASGSGGSSGSGGTGNAAGGSGGTTPPPTDAAMPPVDSGSTLAGNGTDCRSAATCASGFCVDSVCCDGACATLCHGCNLSGSRGTCKAFAAGSQCAPPSCTSGDNLIPARTCDSSGNCNSAGTAQSCGRYQCQNDACLRSCSSSSACVSPYRCFQSRCQ